MGGMIRTRMLALAGRIQGDIPVHHPIMLWLVEHAAELATKHLVGHGGKTAYARRFGNPCRDEGFEFGERAHFRRGAARSASLDARWEDGLWLGRRWGGVSHIVAAGPDEAVEVRAVARRPLSERWSREEVAALAVVPWIWRTAAEPDSAEP